MKHYLLSLRQTVLSVMLLAAMLLPGTVAAAANYNENLARQTDFIPAESPKNLNEIMTIVKKNPNVFSSTILYGKGVGEDAGIDTLSIFIFQEIDHYETDQSKIQWFAQRINFINYLGADRTTVINTNGYGSNYAGLYTCDLAKALNANMVEIEHRYNEYSVPTGKCFAKNGGILKNENYWDYNRATQASADLALIVNTLKKLKIFTGKVVATGASKGGMTTTFLAMHFPETCDLYVPFCAPFCNSLDAVVNNPTTETYALKYKAHSEADYQTWKTIWQRVHEYHKNPTLRAELIKRSREMFAKQMPGVPVTDEFCACDLLLRFTALLYEKTSYFKLEDWSDLTPSYKAPDAQVSKAYCDSMFTFLTISRDSLNKHIERKQKNAQAIRMFGDDFTSHRINRQVALHRAGGVDPDSGIDSLLLKLSAYDVQTMYELGNYATDYSVVADDVKLYGGPLFIAEYNKIGQVYNNLGYSTVAKYINLDTSTSPVMPVDPIEPKVKEFIKTTKAKMVFVYGELDPWTGGGIMPEDIPATQTNIIRYEVPGGRHSDSILGEDYSWDPTIGTTIINKVKEMLGDPTAIETLSTSTRTAQPTDAIYNLSGQRVSSSYHGIVIKNGVKYRQ